MKDILSKEQYEPPEVEAWHVNVERGYGDSDPGGSTTPDMPVEPLRL